MPPARKKLGEFLVAQGAIDEPTLKRALGHQAKWGGKIGRILVEMGAASDDQVARALAAQAGLPYLDIAPDLAAEIVRRLPADIAERLSAVVVSIEGAPGDEAFHVAVADPLNRSLPDDLRALLGRAPELGVAAENRIAATIRRVYYGEQPRAPSPIDLQSDDVSFEIEPERVGGYTEAPAASPAASSTVHGPNELGPTSAPATAGGAADLADLLGESATDAATPAAAKGGALVGSAPKTPASAEGPKPTEPLTWVDATLDDLAPPIAPKPPDAPTSPHGTRELGTSQAPAADAEPTLELSADDIVAEDAKPTAPTPRASVPAAGDGVAAPAEAAASSAGLDSRAPSDEASAEPDAVLEAEAAAIETTSHEPSEVGPGSAPSPASSEESLSSELFGSEDDTVGSEAGATPLDSADAPATPHDVRQDASPSASPAGDDAPAASRTAAEAPDEPPTEAAAAVPVEPAGGEAALARGADDEAIGSMVEEAAAEVLGADPTGSPAPPSPGAAVMNHSAARSAISALLAGDPMPPEAAPYAEFLFTAVVRVLKRKGLVTEAELLEELTRPPRE